MTIASLSTQTSGSVGNGATTNFSFSFRIFANGDVAAEDQIEVRLVTIATGAETVLTKTTHYTVSINGDQDASPGGSITTVSTYSSAYKIYIRRSPNFLQSVDLQNQGAFNAATIETNFDQVKIELQDLRQKMLRAPHVGIQSSQSWSGEMTGAPVAGQVPVVNATADGFILGTPISAAVSSAMTPVVQAASIDAAMELLDQGDFTATGGSVAQDLATRFGQVVTALDMGAATHVGIQASNDRVASGSHVVTRIPAGAFALGSNVTANGRIVSYEIDPAATFSGVGHLPAVGGLNYGTAYLEKVYRTWQRGDTSNPDSDRAPVVHIAKYTSNADTANQNAALAVLLRKISGGDNTRGQGIFVEAIDDFGWDGSGSGSFVEAINGQAIANAANGAAYGGVFGAGENTGITSQYLFAVEGIVNLKSADGNVPSAFDKASFCAAFIATSDLGGDQRPEVAFATNPFTTSGREWRCGFMATEDSVDNTAFANRAACTTAFANLGAVTVGLDLNTGSCSFAAIKIGNSEPIRAKNNAGDTDHSIITYNTADQVVVGTDAAGVLAVPAFTALSSIKSTSASAGVGYGAGAGGTVTQGTNRTTAVEINKVCGSITLFSAAGSTTPASFTVTNSTVAATDVVVLSQKSGTDKYDLSVSAVGAGSFEITFNTKSGTTTEQPVINFAIIKATSS